jgi:hypothetical protein
MYFNGIILENFALWQIIVTTLRAILGQTADGKKKKN